MNKAVFGIWRFTFKTFYIANGIPAPSSSLATFYHPLIFFYLAIFSSPLVEMVIIGIIWLVLQITSSDTGSVFVWFKIAGNLIRIIIFQALEFPWYCVKRWPERDSFSVWMKIWQWVGPSSNHKSPAVLKWPHKYRKWLISIKRHKAAMFSFKDCRGLKMIITEPSSKIIKSELVLRLTTTFMTRAKSLKKLLFETLHSSALPIFRPILVGFYASFCTQFMYRSLCRFL